MKKLLLVLFILILLYPVPSKWIEVESFDQMNQIEIRGHVKKPGIYEVKRGTKVKDVLEMAGCYEDSSFDEINGLAVDHDQDVITVQKKKDHVVYLNSASLHELMSLPGIGEKTAQRILDYRKEHLFQSIEELKEVKGIGEKKFEAIKEMLGL